MNTLSSKNLAFVRFLGRTYEALYDERTIIMSASTFAYAKLVYCTLTLSVSGGVFADFYDIFYAATFMTSLFL